MYNIYDINTGKMLGTAPVKRQAKNVGGAYALAENAPNSLHKATAFDGDVAVEFEVDQAENEKILADQIRAERDKKLSDSDWTVLPDSPLNIEDWKLYRQQLRDIPQQSGFPLKMNWPPKPE